MSREKFEKAKNNKVVRYNSRVQASIFQLYAQGHSYKAISIVFGVHTQTVHYWVKKYNLGDRLKALKQEYMSNLVESKLHDLATGEAESSETTHHTYNDEGQCITTAKVKKLAPSEKALKMLANRYAPHLYEDNKQEVNINVKLTQKDKGLSLEDRIQILNKYKDTIEVEYKDAGSLDE